MPKQLDAELIDVVCKRIAGTGEYPQRVLVHCGASGHQASYWISHGETLDQEGAEPEPGSRAELYLALVRGIDWAEAEIERFWLQKRAEAARSGLKEGKGQAWISYNTFLERRFPDRYKRVNSDKAPAALTFDDMVKQRESA